MKISKPSISIIDDEIQYCVNVESAEGNQTLWYKLEKKYGELVSDRSDAALVALLIPAMVLGEDIYLDGEVSEKLLYNLSYRVQKIVKSLIPRLTIVKIYPSKINSNQFNAKGVATGFSAGIDSFSVLADHYYHSTSQNYTITHLLFNNVGSHGSGKNGYKIFRQRYDALKIHADNLGLPFIYINSNLDKFYKDIDLGFQRTHTVRNTSVALLLQMGIGKYLYASTFPYENLYVGKSYDMAYSEAIILPLISTETLEASSVGSEFSRVEKTLMVGTLDDSYSALDVCVKPQVSVHSNCGQCWKCRRTLITFEIAGIIENYSSVFNLNSYRKGLSREHYLATLFTSKDPLLKEIIEFASNQNYKFPIYSRVLGHSGLMKLTDKVKKILIKKKA